jgi:GSH-dependent disulfide-bond oxidoreductase
MRSSTLRRLFSTYHAIRHPPTYLAMSSSASSNSPAAADATATASSGTATSTSTVGTTMMVDYTPPAVWRYESSEGSKMTMNRPTAGARTEKALPRGVHPIQLYSLGTPNGQKVTILLEELLELGVQAAEYDAWLVDIMDGDQFGSEFVDLNPNSKIPAMRIYDDRDDKDPSSPPLQLFESGSILLHLAERFDNDRHPFLPKALRTEILNWLFWSIGSAPFVGGGFGHFFTYANVKQKYPIDRYTMETKRQLDVLNRQLAVHKYMVGETYTLADIAIFPWWGRLVLDKVYAGAAVFLDVHNDYPHVMRWAETISARPAVRRGLLVNCPWAKGGLKERHNASDFEKEELSSSADDAGNETAK